MSDQTVEAVFNVEAASVKDYIDFIDTLHRNFFPEDPFAEINPFLTLQTYSHRIKVRLDKMYLLVLGYKMELPRPCGQWYEFGYHSTWRRFLPVHYIPGSSFLGMSVNYTCLAAAIASGHSIHTILLGKQPFISAINELATSMCHSQRALSLLVVNLMLCEATRLPFLGQHLKNTFLHTRPLPVNLIDFICKYAGMGASTVDALIGPDPKPKPKPNKYCDLRFQKLSGNHTFRDPEWDIMELDPPQPSLVATKPSTPGAHKFVEVFNVCINSINGKSSGKIYGTISVTISQPWYSEPIYKRGREESEFVCSGDKLFLTGPSPCLCIPDIDDPEISFGFEIFDKVFLPTEHIIWEGSEDDYDKPLTDEFVTHDCSLMLSFVVLKEAVQATVEVTVFDIDRCSRNDKVVAYIYGNISARSSKFDDYESTLFQKTQKEYLDVCGGQQIKLFRSAVVVPWDSSLLIQVELYDRDEGLSFAKGIAEFRAELSGSLHMDICNKIRVRVTWP